MAILGRMIRAVAHRGPDAVTELATGRLGLAFCRLSIMDREHGDQPIFNETRSVVCVCNGEIFNFKELRAALLERGHKLHTKLDLEVLPHLYEEYDLGLLERINAQFALVLFDQERRRLILARDPFGIQPLFYTNAAGQLIFASEIKAILRHPAVRREVDLQSLDQFLALPAIASPRTAFAGIYRVPAGCYLVAENGQIQTHRYWDLDYPRLQDLEDAVSEEFCGKELRARFENSVRLRLQADCPVGVYLSGGLDSSLIAAGVKTLPGEIRRHSFSIAAAHPSLCEAKYQRLMARQAGFIHHEIPFGPADIVERLRTAVYHSECPLKETYNTASLALSSAAQQAGVRVVLSGEGADELFAGYAGYRFDYFRASAGAYAQSGEQAEANLRAWGDPDLTYDKDEQSARETRAALLSANVLDALRASSPCSDLVERDMIRGRHPVHQRSYVDFKIRLEGHLLADHGDRMAMAHSVEARYPFLDRNLVDFATRIPPQLKLNHFTEKYILKSMAKDMLPLSIVQRDKFPFTLDNSSCLYQEKIEWIDDLLAEDRIRREGYFNPASVTSLRRRYAEPGFQLAAPYEDDFLLIVLTFGVLLEEFSLPSLN